jgi:hypothetical protein
MKWRSEVVKLEIGGGEVEIGGGEVGDRRW